MCNLLTGAKENLHFLHTHTRYEFMRHDMTFPSNLEVDEILKGRGKYPIQFAPHPTKQSKFALSRQTDEQPSRFDLPKSFRVCFLSSLVTSLD